jgi:hypothetical protein
MADQGQRTQISRAKAIELLIQDDYVADIQFLSLVQESIDPSIEIDDTRANDLWSMVNSLLQERVDALSVEDSSLNEDEEDFADESEEEASSQLRIGNGRVLHIRKAARTVLVDGLGIVFAFGASTSSELYEGWLGIRVIDILNKLLSSYQKISEENERMVFEEIYRLHQEFAVVNYEALRNLDFSQAYGRLNPTTSDLVASLGDAMDEDLVKQALESLQQRDILEARNGHWAIRLW